MRDRFIGGLLSGIAGGVAKDALGVLFVHILRVATLTYWDYAEVLIFMKQAKNLAEHLFAIGAELTFGMLLGVAYTSYLSPRLNSRHYIIKGVFFGSLVWFAIYTVVLLFRLHIQGHGTLVNAVSDFIIAISYGIIVAITEEYLDHSEEASNRK